MDNPNVPSPSGSAETGLQSNVAAAVSYVLGFITGVYFLVTSKDKFVRFHAMQSTIASLALIVISYVLAYIPFLYMLVPLYNLAVLLLFVLLVVKAYQKQTFKLPVVGDIAEKNT